MNLITGTKNYIMNVQLFDTNGSPKTGLAYGDMNISYARTGATRVAITEATLGSASAAYSAGGFIEIDATNMPGVYRFDVPDAALIAGALSTTVAFVATGVISKSVEVDLTMPISPIHEWHVAKTGADTNGGHSFEDAFLTIQPAVLAALAGDIINIWPGTYTQTNTDKIDLSAKDNITLQGIGKVIIQCTAAVTVQTPVIEVGTGTNLKNLELLHSYNTPASSGDCSCIIGASTNDPENVTIEDCIINAPYGDAINIGDGSNIRIKNCSGTGSEYGIRVDLVDSTSVCYLENCHFSLANWTICQSDGISVINGFVHIKNCSTYVHMVEATDANTHWPVGFSIYSDLAVLENCQAFVESDNDYREIGIVTSGLVTLRNCNFKTTGGTDSCYDIQVATGTTIVSGCNYDITNVSGTITQQSAGFVNDIQTEIEEAGSSLAAIKTASERLTVEKAGFIDAAISSIEGSAGAGAITFTYTLTVTDAVTPIADVTVWVTSDEAGTIIVASGTTNVLGVVTFYLDAATYYLWRQKAGYNFTNPDEEEVS